MKKEILVVVDMQNDFISGSLGSERGKEIVPRVCEKIRSWKGPVIATQDTHRENTYAETLEGKVIPPHCFFGSDGWKIDSTVLDALYDSGASFVRKETFGSYKDLPEQVEFVKYRDGDVLDESELDFTFVGLCTDICVLSNVLVLKAKYPNASFHVDASCCGGLTREKHLHALDAMSSCMVEIQNENL